MLTGEPPRPLRTVLVANRGEIAVRVIRAARDAGLRSVAVHGGPDRAALHVREADAAVALDGDDAASTYLDPEAVVAAAVEAGADAVHPGYGFLSEDAGFACAVLDAGSRVDRPAAGDDPRSRRQGRRPADRAGGRGPLADGTPDPVRDADEVIAFAREHGLPLVVKAAHGGGGRGLVVVRDEAEIPDAFARATREATAAFGRGECFVERFLDRARHVEAQVLADEHGTVLVLGLRDCSLQRRNQKLVEEAPAPFLTAEQEAELRGSAERICRAAGYVGAGTVEYLLGGDGTLSFLEVNTRLQVEHPVTEESLGVDLVAEQFRIAGGAALTGDLPPARAHSIEFRITAEDPARDFRPVPGPLTRFRMPSGPGVRLDSGVEEGDAVDGRFDSMIAKLIVTGRDRPEALRRARRALAEARIEGVPTPLPSTGRSSSTPTSPPSVGRSRCTTGGSSRRRRSSWGGTRRGQPAHGARGPQADGGARAGPGRPRRTGRTDPPGIRGAAPGRGGRDRGRRRDRAHAGHDRARRGLRRTGDREGRARSPCWRR